MVMAQPMVTQTLNGRLLTAMPQGMTSVMPDGVPVVRFPALPRIVGVIVTSF